MITRLYWVSIRKNSSLRLLEQRDGHTLERLALDHEGSTENNSAVSLVNVNVSVGLRSSARAVCHSQCKGGVHTLRPVFFTCNSQISATQRLTFSRVCPIFLSNTLLLFGHILSHQHKNQRAKKENIHNFLLFLNVKTNKYLIKILYTMHNDAYDIKESKWREKKGLKREKVQAQTKISIWRHL